MFLTKATPCILLILLHVLTSLLFIKHTKPRTTSRLFTTLFCLTKPHIHCAQPLVSSSLCSNVLFSGRSSPTILWKYSSIAFSSPGIACLVSFFSQVLITTFVFLFLIDCIIWAVLGLQKNLVGRTGSSQLCSHFSPQFSLLLTCCTDVVHVL